LDDWVLNDAVIQEELAAERVIYANVMDEISVFHHAHAKNIAHMLATGDVLCNVDADNFTGQGFARQLKLLFDKHKNIVTNPCLQLAKDIGTEKGGMFGRIALRKTDFLTLNGYDEAFVGWGKEDTDIIRRAKLLGLKHIQFTDAKFLAVIQHSNSLRARCMTDGSKDIVTETERIVRISEHPDFKELGVKAQRLLSLMFNKNLVINADGFGRSNVMLHTHKATEERQVGCFDSAHKSQNVKPLDYIKGNMQPTTILLNNVN